MIFVFEVHVHPGQAEFVDVRIIGEFEDPDWIVNPGR